VYARTMTWTIRHSLAKEAMAVTFFAALTALGAQVAIRLPFSPVPVTLQVLMVVLTGLVLGSRKGLTSQVGYVVAGALGLPVFAGGSGGLAVLLGPTGGYLLAFPLAAFAAGLIRERLGKGGKIGAFLASVAGVAMIYGGGALWLATWLGMGGMPSWADAFAGAWQLGVAPFILVDLAKAVLAAAAFGGGQVLLSRLLGEAGIGE
jgi:biotin transport system substrate-specific component